MLVTILLSIIYILNIIDYLQTIYAINLLGTGVEANPIGRLLFENNAAWVPKFIMAPVILITIGLIVKIDRRQIWAVYLLLIVYTILVLHNFMQLSQIGIFNFYINGG